MPLPMWKGNLTISHSRAQSLRMLLLIGRKDEQSLGRFLFSPSRKAGRKEVMPDPILPWFRTRYRRKKWSKVMKKKRPGVSD